MSSSTATSSSHASTSHAPPPTSQTHGMKVRFYTSLIVLATIGIFGVIGNSFGAGGFSGIFIGFLSFFASHWYILYGSSLTKQKRVFFDEKNVLDTYQTRNREFGHLFQKEPDTPATGLPSSGGPSDSKSEFNKAVQEHYGNMYENCLRMNQEMDLMEKEKKKADDSSNAPPLAGTPTPKSQSTTAKSNSTSSSVVKAKSKSAVPAGTDTPSNNNPSSSPSDNDKKDQRI